MKRYIFFFFLCNIFFLGCKEKGTFLTSITGSAYEILVVEDKNEWKTPAGQSLFQLLEKDMPGLPQKESYLSISKCSPDEFNSMLKPTRNIIFVDIDSTKYTKSNIILRKDRWASPQSTARLVAPNEESFIQMINERGDQILDYFIKAERNRYITFLSEKKNQTLSQMVYKQFGINILIPIQVNQYKQGKDVLWLSSGSKNIRQDILIYSYPYTNKEQLCADSLLQRRDSICKYFIPGPVDNSYMGTEYTYDKPIFKEIRKENKYCAEIRGLWRVYGNTLMGGPFISHTCIDELKQRVVTIEGFVYAPQEKKRSAIRQLEAVLYTAKMPIVLNEVTVTK